MIVARFFRGPVDGEVLLLPPVAATEVFVIAEFKPIVLEWVYLLAGREVDYWAYLYDEHFTQIMGDVSTTG